MLRNSGADAVWGLAHYPDLADSQLLELAEAEGRVMLTLERDFVQIATQLPASLKHAGVIHLRVHSATAPKLSALAKQFLDLEQE